MGDTGDALAAGSCAWMYVVALEGYDTLLTNGTTSQATDAWAASEWKRALGGLYVELDNDQRLHPWEPFTPGGTVKLYVAPDEDDTFGIDTHRRSDGAETLLEVGCERDDSTLTVRSTTGFDSDGTAYLGAEAFTYSGTTPTTFTGVQRGVFAPFPNGGAGAGFSSHHRVGLDPNAVNLQPVVSAQPRVWIGKRIGVWAHRLEDGELDPLAEAQLVFAGRVVDLIDDAQTGCTVVVCKHVLDELREFPLGRDMWSATIKEGIHLSAGMFFSLSDCANTASTPFSAATNLVVVASGAVAPTQLNSGLYSHSDLCSALNDWLAGELAAGHIDGTYTMSLQTNPWAETRTYITWSIAAVGTHVAFHFFLPNPVAHFLGFDGFPSASGSRRKVWDEGDASTIYNLMGTEIPKRNVLQPGQGTGPDGLHILYLTEERGAFVDQLDSLPASCPPPAPTPLNPGPYEWGIFLLDNTHCVFGAKVGDHIQSVLSTGYNYAGASAVYTFWEALKDRSIDDPPIQIKQVFIIEKTFGELLKALFYSTGTAGYNHATYDSLPYSLSVGVPGGLLGSAFEASIDALPGANHPMCVILDEPTTLADLFGGDLILRWTFLRWTDGGIRFATWRTPTTGASTATLTESNKAAPAGNVDNHGTTTTLTDAWQRSVVKIDYDRDLTNASKDGGYRSSIVFEDRVAVDDAGGEAHALTIRCRHTYAQKAATGAGVEALKDNFLALFPLFSRPVRRLTRSIDARYFEGLSVGDVVTISDSRARDPATGRRGVVSRPGMIVAHRWSPGGKMPGGESNDMGGEVDVLLLDVNRLAAYGPAAQVDAGASGGGYDVGTKTLTCLPHAHSESSEDLDASHFELGMAIRVIEIDPANPAAPLSWDVAVDGQSGNDIIVDSSLTGFDSTLHYRVIFRPFADCTTDQQTKCFQADAGDALVQDLRPPFDYGWGQLDLLGAYTANAPTDQVELPPDSSFDEGTTRDTGAEAALNRLANNLLDYKTAKSSPLLSNTVMAGGGGTWKLVELRPIFLSGETLSSSISRELTVAPWMRSADGSSASVRVTIAKVPPADNTVTNVSRGTFYAEATFTSSSTTWGTATPAALSLEGVKDTSGFVFLLIECSLRAETRGLAYCQEGPLLAA